MWLKCLGTMVVTGWLGMSTVMAQPVADAADEILTMLADERPFHAVTSEPFERLGWDLPDGGRAVKALADAAPGAAFDPRRLEDLPMAETGYRARWHELRYQAYGVDWDITGLYLQPRQPVSGMPTLVIVHGGSSNWYEFFVDPLNNPGLGQYLAQRVPVLLVTIPGNYRHGGWTVPLNQRSPAYVLGKELSEAEVSARNAAYTFQLVADGIEKLVEETTRGPVVIVGHSTAGELPFILNQSALKGRINGRYLGWGSGGTSSQQAMQDRWGYTRTAADYPPVQALRARPTDNYAADYLGPLNPAWDPLLSRQAIANRWMGVLEFQRRPHFKQPLQDIERRGAVPGIRDDVSQQVRAALQGNAFGIHTEAVVDDLFSPMKIPLEGFDRMLWTTARLDTGHWNPADLDDASTLQVADEFRTLDPGIAVRVLLFDVPMTHYGHIERPRQLAGGLYTALQWLMQ